MKNNTPMPPRVTAGFVHIPKTGGTTIKFILRNSTLFRHCDIQTLIPHSPATVEDLKFMRKFFFFQLHSVAGHALRPWLRDLPLNLSFFTMVRDPVLRSISHYQHLKRSLQRRGADITFEDFVRNGKYSNSQVRHIAGCPDLEKAKTFLRSSFFFVGLIERFDESMRVLQKLFPYSFCLGYLPRHVAKNTALKDEILNSPICCDQLLECNRLDVQLYAFVRDELYPAFCEQAGIIADVGNVPRLQAPAWPIKYRLTRFYSHGIYRTGNKIRRLFMGK